MIPQNHEPAPDESELDGFTVEGRKLLALLDQILGDRRPHLSSVDEAIRYRLRNWLIAVERELARVKS